MTHEKGTFVTIFVTFVLKQQKKDFEQSEGELERKLKVA